MGGGQWVGPMTHPASWGQRVITRTRTDVSVCRNETPCNPWLEQVWEALPLFCISGPWKCAMGAAGNVQHQGGGAIASQHEKLQHDLGLGAGHRTYCSRRVSPRLLCAAEAQALLSSSPRPKAQALPSVVRVVSQPSPPVCTGGSGFVTSISQW